jgi:hypothetical protein
MQNAFTMRTTSDDETAGVGGAPIFTQNELGVRQTA